MTSAAAAVYEAAVIEGLAGRAAFEREQAEEASKRLACVKQRAAVLRESVAQCVREIIRRRERKCVVNTWDVIRGFQMQGIAVDAAESVALEVNAAGCKLALRASVSYPVEGGKWPLVEVSVPRDASDLL